MGTPQKTHTSTTDLSADVMTLTWVTAVNCVATMGLHYVQKLENGGANVIHAIQGNLALASAMESYVFSICFLLVYFYTNSLKYLIIKGTCNGTVCDCGFDGNRGDTCEETGCPGFKVDCSRHGACNRAARTCLCREGWSGVGCHLSDCPGEPDCNGKGECLEGNLPENDDGISILTSLPTCKCQLGYYGAACQYWYGIHIGILV